MLASAQTDTTVERCFTVVISSSGDEQLEHIFCVSPMMAICLSQARFRGCQDKLRQGSLGHLDSFAFSVVWHFLPRFEAWRVCRPAEGVGSRSTHSPFDA